MADEKQKLLSVEEARDDVLSLVNVLETEEVHPLEALGRVLAQDVLSDINIAPFDNSAMDGFAVRTDDFSNKTLPIHLEVIEHIGAGDWPEKRVEPGTAMRIMTGAPVPEGADAVIKIEDSSVVKGDGSVGSLISFGRAPKLGENIRFAGEEVKAGETVLWEGEKITAAAVGLLAATGNNVVSVRRRPRVAILATGSELVEIDEKPSRGKIRNSNSYSLAAQVIEAGGIPLRFPLIEDTYEATEAAILKAAHEADYIITSGGVSVGDFDYVKPVLEKLGEMHFSSVNMRPGKPQTLGLITAHGKKPVPFFGLPGNPTSTFVGFEMFVRPALLKMQGFKHIFRPTCKALLGHDVKKRQSRRYYLRGSVSKNEAGVFVAHVEGNQSSALLASAHRANCFIVLPEDSTQALAGSEVTCIWLDRPEGTE